MYGNYEVLAMRKAKLERPHFFKVQSGKITVCQRRQQPENGSRLEEQNKTKRKELFETR